jgi:hypothetical protein
VRWGASAAPCQVIAAFNPHLTLPLRPPGGEGRGGDTCDLIGTALDPQMLGNTHAQIQRHSPFLSAHRAERGVAATPAT